jgi:hypothetical protein
VSGCAFEERVAAYASGEPDDELAAHLPGCERCRAELDEARVLLRRLAPVGEREPVGEIFFADFTRGVREQLAAAAPARRARWAYAVAPALCAAATLVWFVASRELVPTPGNGLPPSAPVSVAVAGEDDGELDFLDEADPEAEVAGLSPGQLDAVLASLDAPAEGDDADADAILDSLDDDQLDAVVESLTL